MLAVSLLQGPAFGLYWISAVTYASELAPDELRSTAQGLLAATTSLAGMSGAAVSGLLFDYIGPRRLFMVLGACCLAALFLLWAGRTAVRRSPLPPLA